MSNLALEITPFSHLAPGVPAHGNLGEKYHDNLEEVARVITLIDDRDEE
jgi:hypothetical protein